MGITEILSKAIRPILLTSKETGGCIATTCFYLLNDFIRSILDLYSFICFYAQHGQDLDTQNSGFQTMPLDEATALEYHVPKLSGLGDVNWGQFFSVLSDVDYEGPVCIEAEDRAYAETLELRKTSLIQSGRKQFMP